MWKPLKKEFAASSLRYEPTGGSDLKLDDFVQDLPRTKPLYLEDAYITSFNAAVLRAELEGKRNVYLILDATAFHPKSGGQPSDTGILEGPDFKISVKKSMVLHGTIVH